MWGQGSRFGHDLVLLRLPSPWDRVFPSPSFVFNIFSAGNTKGEELTLTGDTVGPFGFYWFEIPVRRPPLLVAHRHEVTGNFIYASPG